MVSRWDGKVLYLMRYYVERLIDACGFEKLVECGYKIAFHPFLLFIL